MIHVIHLAMAWSELTRKSQTSSCTIGDQQSAPTDHPHARSSSEPSTGTTSIRVEPRLVKTTRQGGSGPRLGRRGGPSSRSTDDVGHILCSTSTPFLPGFLSGELVAITVQGRDCAVVRGETRTETKGLPANVSRETRADAANGRSLLGTNNDTKHDRSDGRESVIGLPTRHDCAGRRAAADPTAIVAPHVRLDRPGRKHPCKRIRLPTAFSWDGFSPVLGAVPRRIRNDDTPRRVDTTRPVAFDESMNPSPESSTPRNRLTVKILSVTGGILLCVALLYASLAAYVSTAIESKEDLLGVQRAFASSGYIALAAILLACAAFTISRINRRASWSNE
jgi:hypothetical protein